MNKTRGFIFITLVLVISVLAVTLAGAGLYYKIESEKDTNTNQAITNNNVNSNNKCPEFKLPEICTTLYVPGYYYDKNTDSCIFDGNGCTKPYATLKECTQSCASRIIVEDDGVPIKKTCGNVIVYNVEADKAAVAQRDCQARGGTFDECDSPCGSLLAVCQVSCTLP